MRLQSVSWFDKKYFYFSVVKFNTKITEMAGNYVLTTFPQKKSIKGGKLGINRLHIWFQALEKISRALVPYVSLVDI